METTLLSIRNLDVRYSSADRGTLAVHDLSLSIGPGESLALIGESGCGKSTVALAIMSYLGANGRISNGKVLFRGRDLAAMDMADLRGIRGREIAMVYQDAFGALNPTMRIGRQLAEVLETHSPQGSEEAQARIVDMLRAVGLADPTGTMQRYPHQLSGGQQQRVVIAMAFLAEPALLVLDEPTTALDVTVEAEIVQLLARMRKERGTAMLFITHNLGLVPRVCENMAVMYAGQIVEHGPTAQVLRAPYHPYTRGLLGCIPRLDRGRAEYSLTSIPGQVPSLIAPPLVCTFMDRCPHARPGTCDQPITLDGAPGDVAVRCARWRELAPDSATPARGTPHRIAPAATGPVLDIEDLSKTYELRSPFDLFGSRVRRIRAAEHISLTLARGETLGVVGESGSGKSTLARIIMGLEPPGSGRVVVLGDDVTGKLVEQRSRDQVRNVQMVFQNPDSTLNPLHTVGFILGRAVRLLGGVQDAGQRQREVERLLNLVRLPRTLIGTRAGRLSGGQKQRVAVARAFAGRPALIVADEPTSALDTSVKAAILELLLSVHRETGASMVFISHDLAVVRYVANRVCVVYLGHALEIGTAEQVFSRPRHPYTRALLAAVPSLDDTDPDFRPVIETAPTVTGDPPGCPFAPRCDRRMEGVCEVQSPPHRETAPGHVVQCHLPLAELDRMPPVLRQAAE